MLLTEDGWVAARVPGRTDCYLFAYGRDYKAALKALYQLSGNQPLLPRWTLGNWWCRYCETSSSTRWDATIVADLLPPIGQVKYTSESFLSLMDRFRAEDIPLSVAVIDMDW